MEEEEEQPGEPLPSQLGEPSRWGCGGFLSEGLGLVQNRCELQLVVSFFFPQQDFFRIREPRALRSRLAWRSHPNPNLRGVDVSFCFS